MNKQVIAVACGALLLIILYFGFSNKPPQNSVFDARRAHLTDSLQYHNGEALLSMHNDMWKAQGESKKVLLQNLSEEWLKLRQPAIAADYLRQLADYDHSYENYMNAGSALASLISFEEENSMRVNIVYGARYCFEQALKLQPDDVNAKVSLASVIVQGTNNPMEGITMLREVESNHPENVQANIELGRFSIISGQLDKAIDRFGIVLEKDSLNLQAYYLMAQAYLGLKDTSKAMSTLEKAVSLATDSLVVNSLRQEIKELK